MEKYLVASSGNTLESKVSGRFGHSGYFLVVDPITLKYEAFPGVSNYEDQTIRKFINTGISKVIVGNIGPALYKEVTAYGCKIYLCRNMPVPEAIKKVKAGDIPALREPTLKHSIHSARKTGYNYGGRGKISIGKM
jgi:predicted Fe-Mo cluster-binding NifX family protein